MTLFRKILIALVMLCMVVAAFFIGRNSLVSNIASRNFDLTQFNTRYKFISPLLECGDYQASNLMNSDAADIEDNLSSYISARKAKGLVDTVSVYFRDLNNGPYVHLNASQLFVPGSLLKVPVAISVYKQASKNPSILRKKATFLATSPDLDAGQHFKPVDLIKHGETYSLEDLMHYMLSDSDNNAAVLAINFLDSAELESSYNDLGIKPPVGSGDYTVNVKNYASFLRILYNASYLDQDSSEHILSLLAQSTFKDGLVAGLPSNLVVAHKFGERGIAGGKVQLHDCGIIYKPNQPYVLCIMTQGADFDLLAATIADMSHIVYKTLEADN